LVAEWEKAQYDDFTFVADGHAAKREEAGMGARRELAIKVGTWLAEREGRVSGAAALNLVVDLLGEDATFHVGDQYLFDYARAQGYYLPPYPLAGCGEIREFLADEGVRDVPSWYARIGVDSQLYAELYHCQLLVLRESGFWKQAIPLDARWKQLAAGHPSFDAKMMELALYVVDFVCGSKVPPRTVTYR